MKKKLATLITAGTLAAALMTGCGASTDSMVMSNKAVDAIYETAGSYSYDSMDVGGADYRSTSTESYDTAMPEENGQQPAVMENRKLIKTVDMSVETKEFDSLLLSLQEQVSQLGGYIESSQVYNGSAYYGGYSSARDASMTLRIPKERLDEFLDTVSGISNVIRRSDSVSDVTLTYVDMESHRDALRAEQDRLLELMEQAQSMEDILIIEEHLTNVRYQLQSMESQLRTMDNQVDYSTVYLSVSEVRELTPVVEQTFGERITEGFMDSLRDVKDGAIELFIWFVTNLPHLVIWAAIIVAAVILLKKLRRRKKAAKTGKKNAPVNPPINAAVVVPEVPVKTDSTGNPGVKG